MYDWLVGYFPSERIEPSDIELSHFKKLSEEEKLRRSIIENLTMVLQTRQGSIKHLPDFGLPDIMQIYISSGYSFDTLNKHICNTILKYEPRIEKVRIENPRFDKNNMRIFLKIVATIRDFSSTEILLTEFSTTGWTKVVFEKDQK